MGVEETFGYVLKEVMGVVLGAFYFFKFMVLFFGADLDSVRFQSESSSKDYLVKIL